MDMLGELLFKLLVFALTAYGIFALVTGSVLSDPEDGKMRMLRREDNPGRYWMQVCSLFAFAAMLLWAGYIFGPSQVKKQMLKECAAGDEQCREKIK